MNFARPVRSREAVRLICWTGEKVLLLEDSDPGVPGVTWWVTPGGGIDSGETEAQAAVRELREETGHQITEQELSGPLAYREVVHGFSDAILHQFETFYSVATPEFVVDISGHTEDEKITLQRNRWWTLAELEHTSEEYWPKELPELIARIGSGQPSLNLGLIIDESTVAIDPAELRFRQSA